MCAIRLIASSPHEVNNCVQSLLLNYLSALLHNGDFILVYIIKWGNLSTFAIISSGKDGNVCVL